MKKQEQQQQQQKRIVETASAVDGGGGVLVVTVDSARATAANNGRTATLYRAVGGEHSGRSVEAAWEVEVCVPESAAGGAAT